MAALRDHERELVQAMADGYTLRAIADAHGLTYQRAKDTAAAARRTLGAATNEQAVALAVAFGVVTVAGTDTRMAQALALAERAVRVLGGGPS